MPRYQIKKGGSRATVAAADFAGAVRRAAEIGFKDPDYIGLIEEYDREEMRQKAIRAYANFSDRAQREAERRGLGGES